MPTPVVQPNLSGAAAEIFDAVVEAMQGAEELGGPEGDDYLALMSAIADEAQQRAANFREARG